MRAPQITMLGHAASDPYRAPTSLSTRTLLGVEFELAGFQDGKEVRERYWSLNLIDTAQVYLDRFLIILLPYQSSTVWEVRTGMGKTLGGLASFDQALEFAAGLLIKQRAEQALGGEGTEWNQR